MKTLSDVYNHIKSLREPVGFIGVSSEYWDAIRIECQQWCDENEEVFSADPRMPTPNFLVAGIPIVEVGHA